jgi:hypothetical protein
MGTNYYLREDACQHCGRSDERLHIGKSSAGWCFALHVIPEEGINSLDDWRIRWTKGRIFDEYGTEVSPDDLNDRITHRGRAEPSGWTPRDYAENHAEPGPNNMARHKIDGRHCVGHGEGTWDLIAGEFS